MEEKFLEIFFTTTQFAERRAEIINFEQQETGSLYDSWKKCKLLLHKCPNHNINNMEQMQNFIKGLKGQTCMLLDASAGGMIRTVTKPQIKDLIEKMCLNENHSKSERSIKVENGGTLKGMLDIDTHIPLLSQIELFNKKQVESNLSQAQALKCDFC